MFDPVVASLQAMGSGLPVTSMMVFAAGVATSIGPCMAPRLIAVAGISADRRGGAALLLVPAFVAGLVIAYASFGLFASALGQLVALSRGIYLAVAVTLLLGGVSMLLRRSTTGCDHGRAEKPASLGAAFLLGASFAFVISPCCTPVVIAILAFCAQSHSVVYGALLLAVFAMGHAVPIVIVGSSTASLSRHLVGWNLQEPCEIVGGVLMLALSGYYVCLA